LPALLNRALAANDRAKYRLTLLQSAKAHADLPGEAFSSLRTERLACGIADASYDDVIVLAAKGGADTYALPQVRKLGAELRDDLLAMIAPFEAAEKPEAELYHQRLQELSGMSSGGMSIPAPIGHSRMGSTTSAWGTISPEITRISRHI
jgi:hypothetical protein